MVDLAVLAGATRRQIIYEAPAKVVLHLDHLADHLTCLAHEKVSGELSKLSAIGKSALVGGLEHLGSFLLRLLLTEGDGEDMILDGLK